MWAMRVVVCMIVCIRVMLIYDVYISIDVIIVIEAHPIGNRRLCLVYVEDELGGGSIIHFLVSSEPHETGESHTNPS